MESIKCLNNECITLLHQNKLLKPLIKAELLKKELEEINIDEDTQKKGRERFINDLKDEGIDIENLDTWLKGNKMTEEDLDLNVLNRLRLERICEDNFEHKVESHFFDRKENMELIVYSLIRIANPYKARELYFRILKKEADIGDLATEFSEGPEKKTRGIVGPMPIETNHPQMKDFLKSCKVGQVYPPFQINDSHIIVRVENHDPVQLNDFMRKKMSEELFEKWIDTKTNDYINSILIKDLGYKS